MEILSEEEDQFFDTCKNITSVSDSGSNCPENLDSEFGVTGSLPSSAYKFSYIMIMFNLVDENYLISGSIYGKVCIWAIPGCQVVDWTDTTEIVTAMCYRPNGKGGIVGSMTRNCRFYDALGDVKQQPCWVIMLEAGISPLLQHQLEELVRKKSNQGVNLGDNKRRISNYKIGTLLFEL